MVLSTSYANDRTGKGRLSDKDITQTLDLDIIVAGNRGLFTPEAVDLAFRNYPSTNLVADRDKQNVFHLKIVAYTPKHVRLAAKFITEVAIHSMEMYRKEFPKESDKELVLASYDEETTLEILTVMETVKGAVQRNDVQVIRKITSIYPKMIVWTAFDAAHSLHTLAGIVCAVSHLIHSRRTPDHEAIRLLDAEDYLSTKSMMLRDTRDIKDLIDDYFVPNAELAILCMRQFVYQTLFWPCDGTSCSLQTYRGERYLSCAYDTFCREHCTCRWYMYEDDKGRLRRRAYDVDLALVAGLRKYVFSPDMCQAMLDEAKLK